MTLSDVKAMFDMMDVNNDNEISFEEFKNAMCGKGMYTIIAVTRIIDEFKNAMCGKGIACYSRYTYYL